MRTRGHEQAPEIEFSVLASNGEPLPAGHGVEVLLDDSTLGVFESSDGHVQVAGLSNGLHVITVQLAGCSARNVGWRWRATAPFLYMFPLESAGDEDEWQLSWVRTIEFKQRLVILARAGSCAERERERERERQKTHPFVCKRVRTHIQANRHLHMQACGMQIARTAPSQSQQTTVQRRLILVDIIVRKGAHTCVGHVSETPDWGRAPMLVRFSDVFPHPAFLHRR